jgi:hypothetical protein
MECQQRVIGSLKCVAQVVCSSQSLRNVFMKSFIAKKHHSAVPQLNPNLAFSFERLV